MEMFKYYEDDLNSFFTFYLHVELKVKMNNFFQLKKMGKFLVVINTPTCTFNQAPSTIYNVDRLFQH